MKYWRFKWFSVVSISKYRDLVNFEGFTEPKQSHIFRKLCIQSFSVNTEPLGSTVLCNEDMNFIWNYRLCQQELTIFQTSPLHCNVLQSQDCCVVNFIYYSILTCMAWILNSLRIQFSSVWFDFTIISYYKKFEVCMYIWQLDCQFSYW